MRLDVFTPMNIGASVLMLYSNGKASLERDADKSGIGRTASAERNGDEDIALILASPTPSVSPGRWLRALGGTGINICLIMT